MTKSEIIPLDNIDLFKKKKNGGVRNTQNILIRPRAVVVCSGCEVIWGGGLLSSRDKWDAG